MKKMAVFAVMVVAVVAFFSFTATAAAFPSPPDDLNIVPSEPSLPAELAGFLGKWEGTMSTPGGRMNLFLIVEKINKIEAQLYLYGISGQWEKIVGQVAKEYGKNVISFRGSKGFNTLTLRGKYLDLSLSSFTATAIFTRVS